MSKLNKAANAMLANQLDLLMSKYGLGLEELIGSLSNRDTHMYLVDKGVMSTRIMYDQSESFFWLAGVHGLQVRTMPSRPPYYRQLDLIYYGGVTKCRQVVTLARADFEGKFTPVFPKE